MSNSRARIADEAFSDDENESNERRQRRRIEGVEDDVEAAVISHSLMNLNDNVQVNILSFLSFNELNEFDMCSQRCREIRGHESLDQTRVGTVIFTENSTAESFANAIGQYSRNAVFTGNRTHLRVVGLDRVQSESWNAMTVVHARVLLPGVVILDVSCIQQENRIRLQGESLRAVSYAFNALLSKLPNLRELDASHLKVNKTFDYFTLYSKLERVTWTGCDSLSLCGFDFRQAPNLTELMLDDFLDKYDELQNVFLRRYTKEETRNDGRNWYMWRHCSSLERLSFNNATYICSDMAAPEPIPQEMLIKMVRHHSNLRWLRSDLTAENIAMLKQEKPGITFVSE